MRRGDFPAAWVVSDAVLKSRAGIACDHLPRHEQFLWNGGSIAGKRVLVRCYHGLGDTVQFIRYAALVRAQASELIVWAQPSLVELLSNVAGVDHVLPLHDGTPEVSYDVEVESMELPHLFRTTLASIPAQVPYLHPPSASSPLQIEGTGQSRRVGVVWQAGGWDPRRSVPAALLAGLARIPGVVLYAFQRGPALDEWRAEDGPVAGSDDAVATARAMQAMDLIISADSFPAHLAGALGRPVWTLLHISPDWRWMDDRSDSPWYPTMRLFRQASPGDWEGVVAEVASNLRLLASTERRRQGQTGDGGDAR